MRRSRPRSRRPPSRAPPRSSRPRPDQYRPATICDALADRILVLGATGFFGRSVAHGILDAGYQLRALARSQAAAGALRVRGAEVLQGDAVDPTALANACKGCAAVVSLVAVRS